MQDFRAALAVICKDFGVDDRVMAAIIKTESDWRQWAVRYEPIFNLRNSPADKYAAENHITEDTERLLEKCSWGLGQIMGATARSLGFTGPLNSLCEPHTGMLWAVKYYARICKRYEAQNDRIAAYNAGSATFDGRKNYLNQPYVEKVLKNL